MEKLIGYKEAAEFVGLKLDDLYNLVREKSIPHRRLSQKRVKFARSELIEWMRKSKEGSLNDS